MHGCTVGNVASGTVIIGNRNRFMHGERYTVIGDDNEVHGTGVFVRGDRNHVHDDAYGRVTGRDNVLHVAVIQGASGVTFNYTAAGMSVSGDLKGRTADRAPLAYWPPVAAPTTTVVNMTTGAASPATVCGSVVYVTSSGTRTPRPPMATRVRDAARQSVGLVLRAPPQPPSLTDTDKE